MLADLRQAQRGPLDVELPRRRGCSPGCGSPDGRDADLAADATRAANRLRDALPAVSPALERAIGDKLTTSAGLRDALALWGTPHRFENRPPPQRAIPHSQTLTTRRRQARRRHLAALDAQSVVATAEAAWGETISELAGDLNAIYARRDRLTADIEAVFAQHPLGQVLTSMCGFAPAHRVQGPRVRSGTPTASPTAGGSLPCAGLAPVDWHPGRSATARKPTGRQPPT